MPPPPPVQVEKKSLLMQAAAARKGKPEESESSKLLREEQELLRNITGQKALKGVKELAKVFIRVSKNLVTSLMRKCQTNIVLHYCSIVASNPRNWSIIFMFAPRRYIAKATGKVPPIQAHADRMEMHVCMCHVQRISIGPV
jgi:hypothetical protein